jgi:hypothetical protein
VPVRMGGGGAWSRLQVERRQDAFASCVSSERLFLLGGPYAPHFPPSSLSSLPSSPPTLPPAIKAHLAAALARPTEVEVEPALVRARAGDLHLSVRAGISARRALHAAPARAQRRHLYGPKEKAGG